MTTEHDKHLAALQARAALVGIGLTTEDDYSGQTVYIVTRWALTKTFNSLDDVQQWLDSYGVQP